jgi:hypothetical protein
MHESGKNSRHRFCASLLFAHENLRQENMTMRCHNCFLDLAADAEICSNCGAAIATTSATEVTSVQTESALDKSETDRPVASSQTPPYAIFVGLVLGLSLSLAILAFNTADDVAHGYLHIFPVAIIAALFAAGFMALMPSIWNKIESRDQNASVQRRVLVLSILFLLLFVGFSAVVGEAIGAMGKEAGQFLADAAERRKLGKRLAQVRDSMQGSIPSQIATYKEIGPAVERFDVVLHRLEVELPIYDKKFPAQHSNTLTTLSWVETDLRRNDLLKQEIRVAADIEALDAATQEQLWKERIQPLRDAEQEYVPSKY